jgi:hypothetical protein
MRNLSYALLLVLLGLLVPKDTFSHSGPPFTLINGAPTITNKIYTSGNKILLPNELASRAFVVGESIAFGVDRSLLSVDPNLIGENNFSWDFSDGNKTVGLSATNKFKESGSYIVMLRAKDPTYGNEVVLESVRLDVLPDQNYKPPEAILKVDSKVVSNPLENIVKTNKGQEHIFDAGDSKGEIVKYEWDFGDGTELVTGQKVKHIFKFEGNFNYSMFPLLRVTDKSGLTSDAFVQVSNDPALASNNTTGSNSDSETNNLLLPGFLLGGLLLMVILFYLFRFFSKKKAA